MLFGATFEDHARPPLRSDAINTIVSPPHHFTSFEAGGGSHPPSPRLLSWSFGLGPPLPSQPTHAHLPTSHSNGRHRHPPRPRATRAMGGVASRLRGAAWTSDPYYASYERALERIEGESNALEVRTNTTRWKKTTIRNGPADAITHHVASTTNA